MFATLQHRPVPPQLHSRFSTLHCLTPTPWEWTTMPALLGQVWCCTGPVWWIPPQANVPELLPRIGIVGPTSGAFQLMPDGAASIYGAGLWPLGWAEMVREDAGGLADSVVDACSLWPEICDRWSTGSESRDEDACWEALTDAVAALAGTARPTADAERIAMIDDWLRSAEKVDVLIARMGKSARQVERIACRTHGGPPRMIACKWRALRTASELAAPGYDRAKLDERYADQSHLIREFRRFIGMTPGSFSAGRNASARRLAHGSGCRTARRLIRVRS